MNGYGLNDGRAYIVSNTVGLEDLSHIVVPFFQTFNMIGTIFRTLNHGNTAVENKMLMTDGYVQMTKEASLIFFL
jgi:hypothetical protein